MSKVSMTIDTEVAKVVGTDSAIIYQNLVFWIAKNEANEKHYHRDRYWTYNSHKAFVRLFDWLSEDQIKRCLKKLERMGYIMKDNFSENKYDRTTWYALGCLPVECIVQNQIFDQAKSSNGTDEIAGCYNDTDINTDINTDTSIIESSSLKIEVSKTPREIAQEFFSMDEQELFDYLSINPGNEEIKNEIVNFREYWTALTMNGKKQKWEKQETFDIKLRLKTWFRNAKVFYKPQNEEIGRVAGGFKLFE